MLSWLIGFLGSPLRETEKLNNEVNQQVTFLLSKSIAFV